jgi:hypothetical protein
MSKECVFVFVVCGAREHIDALDYSLAALQKFSTKRILVLTDNSRNEVPIDYGGVIDILTPEKLNHHQASIYLKTGLYKYLPKGNLYCYLDTDVVALSNTVDGIFTEYQPPIIFAPDHCLMDKFSPSAVNCGCTEEFRTRTNELRFLFKRHRHLMRQPENEDKKKVLVKKLDDIKKDKLAYKLLSFRFNLSRYKFRLDDDNFLDKRRQFWHDAKGNAVLYVKEDTAIQDIEISTDYRCDISKDHLWTYRNKPVFNFCCNHLAEQIQTTFGVIISNKKWQHWNGGVFLFDERGYDFLNRWHDKTMQIFALSEWKARDQGTLIATAWELGLQNHPTLPYRFNLIADYNHHALKHLGELTFEVGEQRETVKPDFIHVYHHWADHAWDVWQAIEKHIGLSLEPEEKTVHGLWIGDTLSPIELLTIHSFLDKGHSFKLWLYDELKTKLPVGVLTGDANEIIPREKVFRYKNKSQFGHGKGSVAGFSDIFRYKLLFEHGGWWVDMDITCLKKFDFDKPYFFRKHHNLNVVGNVMKCPKGSLLMKRCYDEAITEIDEHNTDWHKPIDILNKHIDALQLNGYIVKDCSNDDRWDDTSRFIYRNEDYPDHWYFIHWQNEEWRNKQLDKSTFYHHSTLSEMLCNFGLHMRPANLFAQWKNEVLFSQFVRKLRERL